MTTELAPEPTDEAGRLRALHGIAILDTPREQDFDDIAHLAATICDAPMAAVVFLDADRQWVKASVGIDAGESPRAGAFCSHTIASPGDLMVITDALADIRFAAEPLVVTEPRVRFYAGAPIVTPDGHAVGAVCVLDTRPRDLTEKQGEALRALARQVMVKLELRRSLGVETAAAGKLIAAMAARAEMTGPPAEARSDARGFRRAIPAVVATLVVAAIVLLRGEGSSFAKAFSDLMFVVTSGAAAAACAHRARSSGRGWWWLSGACALWSAGAVVWAYFGLTRDHVYPFPSVADVGFIGYAVPALAGLWLLRPRSGGSGSRAWALLDNLVIASATLFVSWATVLGPALGAPAAGLVPHAVFLAYPTVDVAVFSAALALGLRQRGGRRLSWALLASGFSTLAVTDSIYSIRQLHGTYETGHILDLGWFIAFLLVALAALSPRVVTRPWLERHLDALQELIPFVPVAAAVVVAAAFDIGPRTSPVLFWLGLVTLGAVAVRQATIVSEKSALTTTLEQRVVARTAELEAQSRFLASVLDSLEEGVVASDDSGRLILFNDAMRRMTGHDLADIPPQHSPDHYQLLHRDGSHDVAPQELPLARALAGEVVRDAEFTMQRSGRAPIIVSVNGRPITSASGDVVGAVIAAHDVTERVRAQQDLERRASRDELTGVANRAAFSDALTGSLDAGAELTLLLLDLDNFKQVNDTVGHAGGDTLLVEVARRIETCVRPGDFVARLGGDEFTIIVEDGLADAEALARRVLAALEVPAIVGGVTLHVAASIGIVTGNKGRSASDLLQCADLAMYDAKATGKATYRVFSQELQDDAASASALERDLRDALHDGSLHLAYQPVVALATGELTGVEALLRWTHPTRGAVSPAEFIPYAERSGVIVAIGDWVLRTACGQLAAWEAADARARDLTMAVNVSIRQLERPGLTDAVRAALEATGISPDRLVLEITESALVDDPVIAERLLELRRLGVKLSIDDFGTGYSSLARLRDFPVDYLKVDRGFVSEIDAATSDAPILRATLAMARGLSLGVIAEGIETATQYEYLAGFGCAEGQGFLMSRPLTAADILPLLGARLGPDEVDATTYKLSEVEELVAAAISGEVDVDSFVRPLLETLQKMTGLESTYLTRIDWDAFEQHIAYAHNAGSMVVPEGLVVQWSDTLCRRALDGGRANLDDVPSTYPDCAAAVDLGITSYVTVPIEAAPGAVLGTLCGASRDRTQLSEADMAVVRLFGRLIAEKLRQRPTEFAENAPTSGTSLLTH